MALITNVTDTSKDIIVDETKAPIDILPDTIPVLTYNQTIVGKEITTGTSNPQGTTSTAPTPAPIVELASDYKSANFVPTLSGWRLGSNGVLECIGAIISGDVTALTGHIGGFTITSTELYGGIIKTAATVGAGTTGVIMDTDGLRGYDSVLGLTFNLPTDGSAPVFSSGIINNTIYELNSGSILRTSSTAGDGTANSAGILINNQGLYGCAANQTPETANIKILIDGTATINTNLKGGQTDFATGTGYFLGYSGGAYKFSIGSITNFLKWDGTFLKLKGSFDIGSEGLLNNSVYTVANLPTSTTEQGYNSVSANQANSAETLDSYSETNQSSGDTMGPSGIRENGQSFIVSENTILDSCKFYLKKTNSPTGSINAKIYAHTGTYGSTGKPGALLATSDNVDVSTLGTSYSLITFTFSGAERIQLTSGTQYFVIYSDYVSISSTITTIGWDGSSPTHGGNAVRSSDGSAWVAFLFWDYCFYVYGIKGDFTNPANVYSSDDTYTTFPATDGDLTVELSKDAGVTWQNPITETFDGTEGYKSFGDGVTELWGSSWLRSELVDATFWIRLSKDGYSAIYKNCGFSTGTDIINGIDVSVEAKWVSSTFSIDHLRVKIYYGISTIALQVGSQAFASNGRKAGEGAGSGTGVLVYYDGSNWIASDTGATVAA